MKAVSAGYLPRSRAIRSPMRDHLAPAGVPGAAARRGLAAVQAPPGGVRGGAHGGATCEDDSQAAPRSGADSLRSQRRADAHSLAHSILLHLAPGALFTAFILLAAPALAARGIDPSFALFGGIGLILAPLELGYLAVYARRTTGSWSPLAAVDYRERVPGGRLALLAAGLAAWFLLCLAASLALLDRWLAAHAFAWMPHALRQFAAVQEGGEPLTGGVLVMFLVVAFACNAVVGPIAEELYFRGHLLPRLERYGRWAPVISTALFATYHFFSPWRYPAIFVGFLPITWMARRKRSIFVSMAAHMAINTVAVLLLVAAALAGGG